MQINKRVLGIFRGFPGLGRVVAGVSLLESLRDNYGFDVRVISYLQGKAYLERRNFSETLATTPLDYCAIGILPTSQFGASIHSIIHKFKPNVIIIDGEPLMIQSIKLSHKDIPIISLLNPSDVENSKNDKEAMVFFKANMSMADYSIIHGLRHPSNPIEFNRSISVNTILRKEILEIKNTPNNRIYCILGGGTVNAEQQFVKSTTHIGKLCIDMATYLPQYEINIVCSSPNIFGILTNLFIPNNVILHKEIIGPTTFYNDASLIITRSGRNTLSELLYLGIPSITFVSGCVYRQEEQKQNLDSLKAPNICTAQSDISPLDMSKLCVNMIAKGKCNSSFIPGNDSALTAIISILKETNKNISYYETTIG